MAEPLVVVGNGMAAARLVDALSRRALGRYAIAVVGAERERAYNRVLLSSLLAGEIDERDIELKPARWWPAHGVTTILGKPAVAIDRADRSLRLADGSRLPFAKLVLATGSQPIRLPIPGADKVGVICFRDRQDVDTMRAVARRGGHAVVIGGGLLGIEAAYGLARGGARVTLVHLMDRLMERQIDGEAAGLLKQAVEARGVQVALDAQTQAILGGTRCDGVRLADGREFPADLVVLAAGVRPNADLARDCGLAVGRGIVVDDGLATADPDIFALGECAEHRGVCYGLVEPAYRQADILAARLCGRSENYSGSVLATNLKVSGVNVFSAGDHMGAQGGQAIVLRDRGRGHYRKLLLHDDRLAGAVLFGDTTDAQWYLDLMRTGAPVGAMRADLIFGRAVAERQDLAAAA